jgi:AraC-like DNA-binding protein
MIKNILLKISLIVGLLGISSGIYGQEDERVFYVFDASNGMAANGAQTVTCTKTGRMVITTIGYVNFYDGSDFYQIVHGVKDMYPLKKYSGHYRLMFDKHHHLWLKDRYNVVCVNLTMEQIVHDVKSVFQELGVNKTVDDLFTDSENMLWTLSGDKLSSPDRPVALSVRKDVALHDVDVFEDLYVLLFYADGMVSAFNLQTGEHAFDVEASEGEAGKYMESSVIRPYEKGFYQISNSSQEGILRYLDVEKRAWTTVMQPHFRLNNMVVQNGKLYVAAQFGYMVINLATGEKQYIEELTLSKGRKLRTDVNTIAFDRQGGMWLGTETRGLLYAKPYPSPFKSYTWNNPESFRLYQRMAEKLDFTPKHYRHHVNCDFTDSRGWKWTGLYTGLELQMKNGKKRIFRRKDGLRNEMVHAVVEDASHDIWVSTSFGISHLFVNDSSVYRIETYVHQDDVPNEAFVNGAAALMDDGSIIMQSLDHMVIFNPASFHSLTTDEFVLYPKLVLLQMNGQDVEPGKEYDGTVILEKAVTRVKEINLDYDQNSVKLTFSGLNYFRPMQTYYRVRVKGTKWFNDWQVFSHGLTPDIVDRYGMMRLTLLNLEPGRYEVEVQTSLSPDLWKTDPFVWVVTVHQPWWRSTGIYYLLAFFMFGLLLVNFLIYNRNVKLRMIRHNEETDVVRRVMQFANRCEAQRREELAPNKLMQEGDEDSSHQVMSGEFVRVMLKLVPYVLSQKDIQNVTMKELEQESGISRAQLYQLLSHNIDKNPHQLILQLRLEEAGRLVRTTDMSFEQISEECRFVSPNYFFAAFFHHFRMTPVDYRKSKAL